MVKFAIQVDTTYMDDRNIESILNTMDQYSDELRKELRRRRLERENSEYNYGHNVRHIIEEHL